MIRVRVRVMIRVRVRVRVSTRGEGVVAVGLSCHLYQFGSEKGNHLFKEGRSGRLHRQV